MTFHACEQLHRSLFIDVELQMSKFKHLSFNQNMTNDMLSTTFSTVIAECWYLRSFARIFFHSYVSFCGTNMTNTQTILLHVLTLSLAVSLHSHIYYRLYRCECVRGYIFYFNYKTFELLSSNWYIVKINIFALWCEHDVRVHITYECSSIYSFASQIPNDTLDNFVLNKCDKFNVCHA